MYNTYITNANIFHPGLELRFFRRSLRSLPPTPEGPNLQAVAQQADVNTISLRERDEFDAKVRA